MAETKAGEKPDCASAVGAPANPRPLEPGDLDPILEKLKLLEFGLYGLQQYRRSSGMDDEDIGPFYRLAEEIGGDVLELQRRLKARSVTRVHQ
ncbi:MAG TPA: hypothetical protein VLM91_27435 [Candidatus Methylomirabilis sp.]|nr:hypothetical protein [Candidatus Methylomirabilis sp.]